MAEIIRNRTIRPSTRLEKSKSYKIDTKNVFADDILVVNIDHETKPFYKTYRFKGLEVARKNNISFRVYDFGTSIDISWSGATPIGTVVTKNTIITGTSKPFRNIATDEVASIPTSTNIKTSFEPISNAETKILVLGTMPSNKSIELGEYYGNSQNRFWKIISTITGNEFQSTYSAKKAILLKSKIGVWDVVHKANRKGSLDSTIKDEEPNDLDDFISTHKNLKVIVFNGKKAESLYEKYFDKKSEICYFSLPSTSSANRRIDFNGICKIWEQVLTE